ncbi:MAG: GGDEF domain-containing protein [Thermomicrobiales bacterium]
MARSGLRDTVARLSGDEFTVLASASPGDRDLEFLAERLLTAIQLPVRVFGNTVPISASAGLVYIDRFHESPSDVLREADSALYRAKGAGRGRLCVEPADVSNPVLEFREPA